MKPWEVHTGDCRVTLGAMAENSVDAIVTDTPYGLSTLLDPPNLDREALWQKLNAGQTELPIKRLMRAWLDTGENPVMKGRGFMGKEWDALVPPPNTWLEAFRVLKPGAALLAFAGTRTAALIEMSIRFAGFEIDDQIATWLYGQGMPKRVRLDLKIDQHFGKDKERPVTGSKLGLPGYHLNPHEGGATYGSGMGNTTAEQRLKSSQVFGPATPEAARFVGYDRALRPGFEPIIVARKPCRGTIAATALRYGTGGFNVDACRIPRGDAGEAITTRGRSNGRSTYDIGGDGQQISIHALGGYPANVIIDERTAEVLDAQSGFLPGPGNTAASIRLARSEHVESVTWGSYKGGPSGLPLDKGGGAARFFYTAKASTSERDKGLEDLPEIVRGGKSGRDESMPDSVAAYQGDRGGGRNPHPTVKPISLMRWLVRLAAPPGAWDPDISKRPIIVDMFAGSGSTLVAGLVEGVRVIGCEMDPQMADVSRRRCQHAYALPREEAGIEVSEDLPRGQASLF